jgi:hypothetical protein
MPSIPSADRGAMTCGRLGAFVIAQCAPADRSPSAARGPAAISAAQCHPRSVRGPWPTA